MLGASTNQQRIVFRFSVLFRSDWHCLQQIQRLFEQVLRGGRTVRLILVRRKLSYVGEGFLWACTAALALEVRLSIYSRRLTAMLTNLRT